VNKYRFDNAIHRIYGYFIPAPGNYNVRATFELAKNSAIEAMQRDLDDVKSITFEQYAFEKHLEVLPMQQEQTGEAGTA
jgi:hypothetical protein